MSSNRSAQIEQPKDDTPLLLGLGKQPKNKKAGSQRAIRQALVKGAKFTGQAIIGGITALQNAANAAAAPTDIDPSQISIDWFNELSTETQALIITDATSSELVNAILNLLFLRVAYGILVNLWDRQKTNLKERIIVFSELLFSLDSAITLGAIAEDSFTFLPYHLNAIPASISGVTNFASRLTGIDNAVMRARNFFDTDAKIQKKLHETLSYLSDKGHAKAIFEKQRNLLNQSLENGDIFDSEYNHKKLLTAFLGDLAAASNANSFQKRTLGSKALSGSGIAFDVLFAAYIGICTFITFMQKGYQGKEDLWNLFTGDNTDSSSASVSSMSSQEESYASQLLMAALGLPSGLTSGALYFTRALDAREMLWSMGEHAVIRTKDNFTNGNYLSMGLLLLAVITLGVANYFASSSGFNMAEKIVESPDTAIIPMEKGSVVAKLYSRGNQIGVLAVNGDTTARKAFLNGPARPDRTLTYEAFLRDIQNQTKILITDESRDAAQNLNDLYEERQNQGSTLSGNKASLYGGGPAKSGAASGLDRDPELGAADQTKPTQRVPAVDIHSGSLKMGS